LAVMTLTGAVVTGSLPSFFGRCGMREPVTMVPGAWIRSPFEGGVRASVRGSAGKSVFFFASSLAKAEHTATPRDATRTGRCAQRHCRHTFLEGMGDVISCCVDRLCHAQPYHDLRA
jgi:hypothetical protein